MDSPIAISENIYWIGVNDLETELFEAIWPLPQGVSYNSYIINDDKVVLIDTLKKTYLSQFVDKIKAILKDKKTVDYLVVNHMEPDHSGAMKVLHEIFPEMQIIGNKKTVDFIKGFYDIDESQVKVVEDGDTLELGKHTLQFFLTPMVHWPETMMTYEKGSKVLFSGDAFGGFGTLNGGIFDDEVDLNYFENEILRYFSNIVGKYSAMVQKALGRLKSLDVGTIASTHGPIFRKDPSYIVNLYDRWSRQESEKGVVIAYASMYGNTQVMAESIARALAKEGVDRIRLHNISRSHMSYVITDVWRFKGLILGSCTYNTKLFPPMEMLVRTLENDKLKDRVVGIFGSYSWSGGAVKELKAFAEQKDFNFIQPVVESKFAPCEEDISQLRLLGKNVAAAL
jgi:flavorubredoxin